MIRIYLSRLMGERRITQAELSRLTGIRAATIHEMYHEIIERINMDHIDLICEALHCRIDDLLEYIPNKQKRVGTELIFKRQKDNRSPGLKPS